MYGEEMGSLDLRILHVDGTQSSLWSKSGDLGDVWFNHKMTVNIQDSNDRVWNPIDFTTCIVCHICYV